MFVRKRIADIIHLPICIFKKAQRRLLGLPFIQKIKAKAYVPDKKYVMRRSIHLSGKTILEWMGLNQNLDQLKLGRI